MTVKELNRDQLVSLKQKCLSESEERVYWGELAEADAIVSDEEVFSRYGDTDFCEEDFA